MRRFPDKFSTNFEENKSMVNKLIQGATTKVRNQIAGYITHMLAAKQTLVSSNENAEEAE